MWYFIAGTLQSCGGILAYGLMQMDGVGGLAGWRWVSYLFLMDRLESYKMSYLCILKGVLSLLIEMELTLRL